MHVLLDTQAVLAAYFGALPQRILTLLTDSDTDRFISSATIIEIAVKNSVGKLKMTEANTHEAIRDLQLTVISFEPRHAYRMFSLPLHHRDPFDRMIIATAVEEGVPLIGADRQFRRYRGLKVIW